MCKNEHCFCRGCITKHLENYHTCPCCNQDLTVKTLADAPRFFKNLLSEQRMRCDHHKRGCQEIVQLGNLACHVAVCGKAPVLGENEECSRKINREDQFRHQGEECRFHKESCRNCKEMSFVVQGLGTSLSGLRQDVEMLNTSFDGMKIGLTDMENKIKEIESAATINNPSPAGPSNESNDTKHLNQCGYLVAGGDNNDTVEVFDKILNSWIEMIPMKMSRSSTSSVFYKDSVLVTEGTSNAKRVTSSIEQCSFNTSPFIPLSWSDLAVKLPRPSATSKVTMYYITKNEFNELKPLPYRVCNMATVMFGENVILVGGSSKYGSSSNTKTTVINYNIKSRKSTQLPKMSEMRSECCAVFDGNSLVVMGGDDSFGTLSSVEAFDFKTSTWSDLPSMKEERKAFIAEIV